MFFFFLVFFKSLFGQLKSKQPFFGSDEEYMNLEFICLCLCMSVYVCNELKLSHLTLEGDVQLLKAEDEGRKNTVSSLNETRTVVLKCNTPIVLSEAQFYSSCFMMFFKT